MVDMMNFEYHSTQEIKQGNEAQENNSVDRKNEVNNASKC